MDTAQNFEHGGFSRTIATQKRMDFARPHFQGDVVKDLGRAKGLADSAHLYGIVMR